MKLVRSTFVSLATLVVVFIAILSGCSGSDPLSTTVGSLVLDFQITDPGSTEYEEADFLISKAIVRPASAEALESLGDAGISLLANEVLAMDLNSGSTPLPAASLPAGTFILEEVSFLPSGRIPITLVNNDVPDPMAACIDRKTMLPGDTTEQSRVAQAINGLSVDRRTFRPNAPIVIPSGEIVNHPIRINSAALIQAYKNAFTCSDNPVACRVSRGGSVPCITSFNANGFITELEGLDWITY
jgi:hypothetical protein